MQFTPGCALGFAISGALLVTFVPGVLPPHPEATHPRLKISPYLTAAVPPPSVDWYSRVRDWPMFLNDSIGDCTVAMEAHILEASSTYGRGSTVEVDDRNVLAVYRRVSGYNPDDSSTDRGAVLQDVYSDWRTNGLGLNKILAFAQVNHDDILEQKTAVEHFGAVGLGITVTQGMVDEFNAGRSWTVMDAINSEQLGGHAVPIVGYDDSYVYVVTWGRVQPTTWGCLTDVVDEAWVAVLPEWFDSAGHDPEGVDLHGLGEAFAALTGEANPFPVPSPQPTPSPPPGPVPQPVDPADEALAVSARAWLSTHHVGANGAFAKQVRAWLEAKHLS
jgi:hypothetical protein